jgi:branched-chain amino acid aminotransferase
MTSTVTGEVASRVAEPVVADEAPLLGEGTAVEVGVAARDAARGSDPARLDWAVRERPDRAADADRLAVLAAPGFGQHFTDHMATATWTAAAGWTDAVIGPYAPFSLSPATAVFHYSQTIFEGLKAYRHPDDSIWLFRPESNAARFANSARRLALPVLPEADFLHSLTELVTLEADWVPTGGEMSLYLRPFMFASEAFLGVRPSARVTYCVLASPAGSYFSGGVAPVRIWVSREFTRAAPGGTGAAKCGGNYAAGLLPQQEAYAHGCDQVVFLDAVEREYIEELGGMNLWFVMADGTVATPPTGGTILPGITRDAIVTLLTEAGHTVREQPYSLADWRADAASGRLAEVFACGTAAVVTPVGTLVNSLPDGSIEEITTAGDGSVTSGIRQQLLDIQHGRTPDTHGWLVRVR